MTELLGSGWEHSVLPNDGRDGNALDCQAHKVKQDLLWTACGSNEGI